MTDLVDLEEDEDGDDIHEGGVELEVDFSRTDVVAGGEDALHGEGPSHGVEDTVLLGDAPAAAGHVAGAELLLEVTLVALLPAKKIEVKEVLL